VRSLRDIIRHVGVAIIVMSTNVRSRYRVIDMSPNCNVPGSIRAVGDSLLSISCNVLGFRVTVTVSDRVLVAVNQPTLSFLTFSDSFKYFISLTVVTMFLNGLTRQGPPTTAH